MAVSSGRSTSTTRRSLARLRHGHMTGVAVLLDVATWEGGTADEVSPEYEQAQAVLAASGWRVLRLPAGTSLATVWPDAAYKRSAA